MEKLFGHLFRDSLNSARVVLVGIANVKSCDDSPRDNVDQLLNQDSASVNVSINQNRLNNGLKYINASETLFCLSNIC